MSFTLLGWDDGTTTSSAGNSIGQSSNEWNFQRLKSINLNTMTPQTTKVGDLGSIVLEFNNIMWTQQIQQI